MFQGSWTNTRTTSFIIEARKRTKTIWLGNHLGLARNGMQIANHILTNLFNETDTQARECFIDDCNWWNDFIDSCLSRGHNLKDQVLDMLDENERSPDQLINRSKDYRTIR